MKLFDHVVKSFKTMGIYPSQSVDTAAHRNSSINIRNVSFLISFLLLFASTTGAFWFLAQTKIERVNNFYIALTELACINSFIITWHKVANKMQLVGKIEKFIEKRECQWPLDKPKTEVEITVSAFLPCRISECRFKSEIHWPGWATHQIIADHTICFGEGDNSFGHVTRHHSNDYQLFHVGFGQWIICAHLSTDVCVDFKSHRKLWH